MTVLVKGYSQTLMDGRLKGSRLVWRAPGMIYYVRGAFASQQDFDLAQIIVSNDCLGRHIPLASLRHQSPKNQKAKDG